MDVLLAGDINPIPIPSALAGSLGLSRRPDLFLFTVDAAVADDRPAEDQSCISFFPDALDDYRLAPITIAVTASNHVTDFGAQGLRATLEAIRQRGMVSIGAGETLAEAEEPAVVDLPGGQGRLTVLAFADTGEITGHVGALGAGPVCAGVAPFEVERAERAVARAAQNSDWVWVVLHWGEEFVRYPNPEQRRAAWRLVDAGASVVAASHTHVPLGYERRGDGIIFYGLGNFVYPGYRERRGFNYRWHPMARRGVVVLGRLRSGAWTWWPMIVRHDAWGFPRLQRDARCADVGATLPADLGVYQAVYRRLRQRERLLHLSQRLLFMTMDERLCRLREFFNRTASGSRHAGSEPTGGESRQPS